jgi:hypothetical protein
MGALKLGIAVGIGYSVGGKIGEFALSRVTTTADMSTHTGAMWAGRIVTFAAILWIL